MSPSVSSHAANPDCTPARIDPAGPLERPKPATSVPNQVPNVVIDERVFPLPAERRVHASLHPAEQFAQDVLSSGEPVTATCVERLFNLLPSKTDVRFSSDSGRSFVAGVFRHGGVVGLTNTCRSFPQSVSLAITWAMQQAGPQELSDFTFCSISLNLNVKTEVHRDVNNDDADNLVLAVTTFSGGHIWVQSESGGHVLPVNGSLVPGDLYDVSAAPVRFYARKRLHCTMPWTGDRLVLILFSGGDVAAKVKGLPLDSLMFLDVFCGTGGLCASLRQLSMKLSVGFDRHAQRGCKCPVISLDLTKAGSRAILLDLLKQPHVVACHLSPPVTTSGAGLLGPRSGTDLELVQGANALFAMSLENASLSLSLGPADQLPCTSKTKLVSTWAACKAKHPRSLDQGVPAGMSACIDRLCEHSSVSVARDRTAELRKWVLRKKELDESFVGPEHCKKVLAGKPMKLFGEMVEAAGHADVNLVRDIQHGFDLLGEIPSSSVLPKKTTVASLSIEDVRIATPANQRAIWETTRTCRDPEITSEVYRLTLEERDKGWLTGPFTLADVPETAIITRRFGVRQGVTTTATGVAAKIRPIDDFTESLANLSCTCAETIDPHSVNIIALLHIHWSVFFDDFVAVSSPEEKGHLDLVLRSYFALIGWETSDEKDTGFRSVAKALGVEFCLDEIHLGLLRVQNTEARKRELVSTIEAIVQHGGAHAKELECLRGRLQFAESQVFGRGAAQRMRAISKAMKLSGFVVLDDSLTEALLFLKDRVLHGEARMIRACDRPTYHLFTDASYEADVPAGLGGILYSDGGLLLRWYSESADTDVLEAINKEGKQGLIYELEACAAVQGVVQLCNSLSDCNLICYCDNEAALAALIKCASESPVVASQLNKLSMLEDEKGLSVWFERVESSANPADDPSRFVLGKLPTSFRVRWIPGEELLF
ncbi:unnamed protein product [Symbiodinium sp. CCMP2592]|nr:unnamed protein product [Symbiodinium sp. CCMP2592]